MEYKIGLRNKVALCITLPKKAVEGAGMGLGTKVSVEGVAKGYYYPCDGIFICKAQEAPKAPVEEKPTYSEMAEHEKAKINPEVPQKTE